MKILFAGKPVQQLVIELYGNAIAERDNEYMPITGSHRFLREPQ